MRPLFLRTAARGVRAVGMPRRQMGGGHGHGPSKPAGPYDLPHHAAYPDAAYPFGLVPGKPKEGWEYITLATYMGCFVALVFGLSAKGNSDSFTEWARREALAREAVVENGGEIEFGKYYQTPVYEADGVEGDTMPKIQQS